MLQAEKEGCWSFDLINVYKNKTGWSSGSRRKFGELYKSGSGFISFWVQK